MIICLGTTPTVQRTMTFEHLVLDSVNRATHVHEYASGKSVNAARVLHTLGDDVLATGFLGGDSGKVFRDDLDQSGIKHEFVSVTASTRLCITVIDRLSAAATELIEESKPVLPADYDALLITLADLLPRAQSLILSGTLAPGGEDDLYARAVKLASQHKL